MNPLIQHTKTTTLLLVTLVLVCVTLLPSAQAQKGCNPTFTTAAGCDALNSLTTGTGNTAIGWRSLLSDSTGSFNTGVGAGALILNTTDSNTAVGAAALLLNTTGTQNTAVGTDALVFNDSGGNNTATGAFALFSMATGDDNTAIGFEALKINNSGSDNTAVGRQALVSTAGNSNTAVGAATLLNASGSNNTALGFGAGDLVISAENVIAIGSVAADVSDSCFIGNIRGVTTANADALPVFIDSAGQLGTASSSVRFKNEIKPMDKASEAILALKPVTFHYKNDKKNTPQFGLIAEEVAKVNQDLVVRDKNGEIYTVRYDQVNAMLLNEFLKAHRKVEEQQTTITQLKKDLGATIAQLTARLDEQASQIQKVSAQLEASKPAPQVVNNP